MEEDRPLLAGETQFSSSVFGKEPCAYPVLLPASREGWTRADNVVNFLLTPSLRSSKVKTSAPWYTLEYFLISGCCNGLDKHCSPYLMLCSVT